jgi:hypothetical protein
MLNLLGKELSEVSNLLEERAEGELPRCGKNLKRRL